MKTHYRKLMHPNYIGSYELMTEDGSIDLDVKIGAVTMEEVTGPNNRKEDCMVAQLEGYKPLIVNATNAKTIEKIAGSPFIEDWKGVAITLFVQSVSAFGQTVDALRIRPTAPKLPELTPKHPKWAGAKQAIKDGNVKIEQIKKQFLISATNEAILIK